MAQQIAKSIQTPPQQKPVIGYATNAETQGYVARSRNMRWLVAIVFLILVVLVDQFRFQGYYTREILRAVENTIRMFTS